MSTADAAPLSARPLRLLTLLLLVGCGGGDAPAPAGGGAGGSPAPAPATDPSEPWFEESAEAAGLDFLHVSGADPERLFLPEIVCGGAALLDYDGDGDLDLYCVQGGRIPTPLAEVSTDRLYRNRGDGTFEDVTTEAGAGVRGYGMGCAANDFDGDGDIDIFVSNVGPNVLLRNRGDGTFEQVPDAAGAAGDQLTASASFFDADADGDLDLFVTEYVGWSIAGEIACSTPRMGHDYCQPNNYQSPTADHLYRNDAGRFVDVTEESGIGRARGNGLGVVTGDFDGDGRLDLFVANDGTHNHHWLQTSPWVFEERGLTAGTAVNMQGRVEAGMGVAAIDIDGDDDLDLFLSHLLQESNTLYLDQGGYYDDATDRYGLGGSSMPYTGFGLGFHDFDLDGDLDLFVANGRVMAPVENVPADPYEEPNLLYEFEAGRFRVVTPRGGTSPEIVETSRGAAFGDVDNDGDVDIVVVNRDGRLSYLRNRREALSDHHWVTFDVREGSGAFAQQAQIRLEAGGRRQTRVVDPHSSYASSNDPRAHFGLGAVDAIDGVEVRWADGTVERFAAPPVDRIVRLIRGEGESR
ncbi:MAG: CRTAC1 family protein [Planctomycetota bacterium]